MMSIDAPRLAGRRVLVTDGELRASLAIVRSLGRAGAVPFVSSAAGASIAGASRFAAGEMATGDPLLAPDDFMESLLALVARESIECLVPVSEAALRLILRRDRLTDDVVVPFPSHDMFSAACDKRRVTQLATRLGIPVPRQVVLDSPATTEIPASAGLDYPLVLKPGASVASAEGRAVKLSVRHVAHPEDLRPALAALHPAAFPLLVQERVPGAGIGIFLLRWNGRILARFAHRRIREKPPSGGVSVYCESIQPPSEALRHSELLLEELDWTGVAMVEFKLDDRTGLAHLMEINGRFWGSLQLAIDSGVDFPTLLLEAADGRQPSCPVEGRPGVRLRWVLGDLDHLLQRLRRSPEELALGAGSPGSLATLGAFLVPWRPGERRDVLRASDPRPFLREFGAWIADALKA